MTQRHTPQNLYLHSLSFSQPTDTAHISHLRLGLQEHLSVSYRFPDKNFIYILSYLPTRATGSAHVNEVKMLPDVQTGKRNSVDIARHVLRSTNCVSPFGAPSDSNRSCACRSLLQNKVCVLFFAICRNFALRP
jgi:hypothetical protein